MSNSIIKFERQVLDHGYIRLIESWGSDERIVETARTSTSKGLTTVPESGKKLS